MTAVEVAGGVVINTEGEILIVNQYGNSWSLPKGHLEIGEDLLTAAKREIEEESGVKELEYLADLGSYERMGGKNLTQLKRITIFLFHTTQKELQPLDPNNPEARWIPKKDVVNFLTHEKDKEFWLSAEERVK